MAKRRIYLVLLCIFTLILNGCWDRRELESLGLVQALGLDPGPEGKGVTITTTIAIPPKIAGGGPGGGGGGGSDTGVFIISIDAPSIYEGLNRLNTTINREITLLQNSTLVISKDLAEQGISKWMDNLARFRDMRRTMLIFIADGKAAEIMNIKPKLEKNPAEYFTDLVSLSKRNGMFPITDLNSFSLRYEAATQETYAPLIAKYKRQEAEPGKSEPDQSKSGSQTQPGEKSGATPSTEDVRIIGTAIFKLDKMVGSFDNYESQALLLLTNQFGEALLSLPDPKKKDNYIVFRLLATTPVNIRYRHQGSGDHFFVKLKLEADIVSIQSGIDYTIPKMERFLAEQIGNDLKKRIDKAITKAQKQFNSDIFGFGEKVRPTFLTSPAWNKYRWPERFKDAQVDTSVKVSIRRVGVQFEPPRPK
jgi:spore germination protein KC